MAPPQIYPQLGMKMAGNFRSGFSRASLVAQKNAIDEGFVDAFAAEGRITGRSALRIVIAGDPRPAAGGGESDDPLAGFRHHPVMRAHVMKAVPQAPDFTRCRAGDHILKGIERGPAVIGRQHLPAPRKGACLLEMQIGDDQRCPLAPEQGALRERMPVLPGKAECRAGWGGLQYALINSR